MIGSSIGTSSRLLNARACECICNRERVPIQDPIMQYRIYYMTPQCQFIFVQENSKFSLFAEKHSKEMNHFDLLTLAVPILGFIALFDLHCFQ